MTTDSRQDPPVVRDGLLFEVVEAPTRIRINGFEDDVDLLLRIRATGRLVAVVFRPGRFEPEMLGPLGVALAVIDETRRGPGVPRSAGIVVCDEVDPAVAATAMAGWRVPIRVAETVQARFPDVPTVVP